MQESFDCAKFAEEIRLALLDSLPGVEIADEPNPDVAALTFVHPVHEATIVLVVERAGEATPTPTLLLAVVIGDWNDLRAKDGGAQLFALNPQLMTCAVGLMPLNEDEIVVVLCRRVPVETVQPGGVLGTLDDMIWEYAACAGWLEGSNDPAIAGGRSRLISSLDEL